MGNLADHRRKLEENQRDIHSKGHRGLINSMKQSKQDLDTELRRIRPIDDVYESPMTYSREQKEV